MFNFDFQKLWEQGKVPVILGMAGLLLVSLAIFANLFLNQTKEPEIEILSDEEGAGTIWVDLAGAVIEPGVYELPGDSRLKDLLALAGGLTGGADRIWVEKNLNLAQKLVDSQKVYIPIQAEAGGTSGEVAGESTVVSDKININSASASELDTLWGIGEARAKGIIDNRPYASIEELLSKKIIPANVFEAIKEKISVF
ncbi:MAG: ComEA family DNA-binding protein [Candidatus Marinimicrobia bacterium]|nr:ComEA family DNA-binding protein [Candidatus Neomarinimicrobiota bacterium]